MRQTDAAVQFMHKFHRKWGQHRFHLASKVDKLWGIEVAPEKHGGY